jgi:hypothetical protein
MATPPGKIPHRDDFTEAELAEIQEQLAAQDPNVAGKKIVFLGDMSEDKQVAMAEQIRDTLFATFMGGQCIFCKVEMPNVEKFTEKLIELSTIVNDTTPDDALIKFPSNVLAEGWLMNSDLFEDTSYIPALCCPKCAKHEGHMPVRLE